MSRHPDFVPQGVIPAVLLPFCEDLSIDEPSFRAHLRDVRAVEGLSAITINAHSTEVASCTEDEQRRVMEIAGEEVGGTLPIIHGVSASNKQVDAVNRALRRGSNCVTRRRKPAALKGALRRKHGFSTFLDGGNSLLQFGTGKGMKFECERSIEDRPGHPEPVVHSVFGEPNGRRRSLGKLGRDLKRLRIELGIVDRE